MDQLLCNYTEPDGFAGYPERPVQAIVGMLSFFCFLGTTGNAMVLYVYARKKNKLPSTIFIISLAGTDLSVCVLVMPYTMTVEYLNYELTYDFLCKMYLFLITSNVPVSAFIMVAIAVDRYLCICHPHLHFMDARRAKLVLMSLVFFSCALGVITALAYGVYHYYPKAVDLPVHNFNTSEIRINISEDSSNITCTNSTDPGTKCTMELLRSLSNCSYEISTEKVIEYNGVCSPSEIIFSKVFRKTYQKLYAGIFLVAFVVVFVLYILIYKLVLERRTKKMRQRRKTMSVYRETSMVETEDTVVNGNSRGRLSRSERKKIHLDKDGCIKEKYWLANIRTALMLFVVTLVFIIAFLPSWLMAHRVVTFNPIVFYLYFAYNVSNPIIYAFMNPTFRRELKDVVSCRKCMDP